LARRTSEKYRDTDKTATEICQELGVSFALEGSFRKYGDQARLSVRLIRSGKEDHAWAKQYDREWKEIFAVESEVAQAIAKELQAVITEEEQQGIETIPTNSFDAYDYYLLGKYNLNNHARDEDLWKAIEYFKQAVTIDPAFALAYSGLADAYYQFFAFALLSPREVYPKVSEYSQKALELNEELAYTHCLLGLVKQSYEYDYSGAEKEYMRALEIDPKSVEAHTYYAGLLHILRRTDEAIVHIDRALELDPNLFSAQLLKSFSVIVTGTIEEGLKSLADLRNIYPDNPAAYWYSAVRYTHLGRYDEALSMIETQLNLMGDDNISDEIGLLGYLYGRMDQKDKAQKQLARLDELSSSGYYVSPRTRVWIYLGLDNLDKVFSILEEALIDHSIDPESFMNYFYPIESLQSDPRFFNLLSKIGLAN
jgi:tetratricopeptide (TPR) repeat protein